MPDRSRTHGGPRLHSSPHRARRLGHRSLRRMSGKEGKNPTGGRLQRRVLRRIRRSMESRTATLHCACCLGAPAATATETSNCYARRAGIECPHFARIARRASANRPRGIVRPAPYRRAPTMSGDAVCDYGPQARALFGPSFLCFDQPSLSSGLVSCLEPSGATPLRRGSFWSTEYLGYSSSVQLVRF
jgi:hypothetical protein